METSLNISYCWNIPELQLPSRSCYTGIPGFYAAHRAVLQSGQPAGPLLQHPCSWGDGIPSPGKEKIIMMTESSVLFLSLVVLFLKITVYSLMNMH